MYWDSPPLPSLRAKLPRWPPVWWPRNQGTSRPRSTFILAASAGVSIVDGPRSTGLSCACGRLRCELAAFDRASRVRHRVGERRRVGVHARPPDRVVLRAHLHEAPLGGRRGRARRARVEQRRQERRQERQPEREPPRAAQELPPRRARAPGLRGSAHGAIIPTWYIDIMKIHPWINGVRIATPRIALASARCK